jgi:hypothetical protein
MLKRLIAIVSILACASAAWFILAGAIEWRTVSSNEKLKAGVATIWGTPHDQRPPAARFGDTEVRPESSRVAVDLRLEHRQRGLLWYSTYAASFNGIYTFRNPAAEPRTAELRMPLPTSQSVYDGVAVEINGQAAAFTTVNGQVSATTAVGAGETATLAIRYRSQGLDSWRYRPAGDSGESRDFQLTLKTNFADVDFPIDTLSPTAKRDTGGGWELTWRYESLISGFQIGVAMPEKLQPGPLAGQISYFAPISLLLFFFAVYFLTILRGIDLHPMNYFFLAAAFFSFHLLLAYLVDHISIHLAFAICSVVSVFLVVSYLRLVTGMRFAVVEAGVAQLVYLILFSYSFFFRGMTGLTVTIGCIVTLFAAMQFTARIRWSERFRA